MKTAERTGERWVVDVEEIRDLEHGVAGYRQRFEFYGEDAAPKAWACWAAAERYGLKASCERVKRY